MFCPKCGKEIADGSICNFCMYCGTDLRDFKAEPKIEISPKIHAEAKAEGVPYPKWKPRVEKYVDIKGKKLPVYKRFAKFQGKYFCPQCGSFDSLEYVKDIENDVKKGYEVYRSIYEKYTCLACNAKSLIEVGHKILHICRDCGSLYTSYCIECASRRQRELEEQKKREEASFGPIAEGICLLLFGIGALYCYFNPEECNAPGAEAHGDIMGILFIIFGILLLWIGVKG